MKEIEVEYDHFNDNYETQFLIQKELEHSKNDFDRNYLDYMNNDSNVFVKVGLKTKYIFGKTSMPTNSYQITIQNRYTIPFPQIPDRVELKNKRSAKENQECVSWEIKDLLDTNRVVQVPSVPHVVNPLSVSTNKDRERLRSLQPLFTKLAKSHISAQFFVKSVCIRVVHIF